MIGTSSIDSGLLALTTQIVTAHAHGNAVPNSQLPGAIREVYQVLKDLETGETSPTATTKQQPAVSVKKSVSRDRIICLKCGEGFTLLKRHLFSVHDQTPGQYRAEWHLDANYPMTAPSYSETRSVLAKQMGLGRPKTLDGGGTRV